MKQDHPMQNFLFYYSNNFDEASVALMQSLVDKISDSRSWVIRAPQFIDETDPDEKSGKDYSIRTVGGVLEIYSALPPWGEVLPREIDQAHYEEVEAIVIALCELSKETDAEIGLELGGEQVGWIQKGVADRGISEILLGEWKKALEA